MQINRFRENFNKNSAYFKGNTRKLTPDEHFNKLKSHADNLPDTVVWSKALQKIHEMQKEFKDGSKLPTLNDILRMLGVR